MSSVLKLCGVLVIFALAVLANPITTTERTLSKTEGTIAEVPLNVALGTDEENVTSDSSALDASTADPLAPKPSATDPSTSDSSSASDTSTSAPSETDTSLSDQLTSDTPTSDETPPDASSDISTQNTPTLDAFTEMDRTVKIETTKASSDQAQVKVQEKSATHRTFNDDGDDDTTEPATTAAAKPATTTAPNGSSLISPNRMSIAALTLILTFMIKMFVTY